MSTKPKKWIAVVLNIIAPPIGMMYVAQLRWAGIYFLIALAIGVAGIYLGGTVAAGAMQLVFVLVCAIHAYRFAASYPDEKPRPGYSRWYGLLGTIGGLFSVAFAIRAFVVEPFRFPSGSMLPSIPLGAHLIVQKWGYGNYGTYGIHALRTAISSPLRNGDVIVFEYPRDRSTHYAKRLIGLPGDKVTYREKRLTINGSPVQFRQAGEHFDSTTGAHTSVLAESLLGTEYSVLIDKDAPNSVPSIQAFPFRDKCAYDSEGVTCDVPAGHYFTLGDNRDNSADSRMWGFVPADHIVGKVLYILP